MAPAQAEVVVALREDVTGAAHLLTVVNLEVAIADVTLQEGRVGGDEGRVGRGKEGRGEGVCGGNDTVLPGDDVDKPEDEGRRPHVTEVGQGVEEGHVGATNGRVADASKKRHDGHEHDLFQFLDQIQALMIHHENPNR